MAAASAAAFQQLGQPAPPQPVDAVALQIWCNRVDGRLDDQATAITGVGLELQATIGHAKDAMNTIVDSVRVEFTGFKRQVHHDHEQLNTVVAETQQKFAEVEGVVNRLAQDMVAKLALVDARAAGAEQRIAELLVLGQARARTPLASSPPFGTPLGTPPQSPRTRSGGGGGARFDPWASFVAGQAAAPAPGVGPGSHQWPLQPPGIDVQQPPGIGVQHFSIGTPKPQQPLRDFRVDNRSWGDNRRLDLVAAPEAYLVWRDRALGHLCRDRPDIRRLLVWAEAQSKEELEGAAAAASAEFGVFDLEMVDYVLFEGIKYTVTDALLTRARACEGHGVELWRRLHCEWKGSAPQLKHANARKFQDPARCPSTAGLWEALPEWERLGEEVQAAGFQAPDWIRVCALEKLVPADLLSTLVSRPELDTYGKKLHWVKSQMEHSRGVVQARAVSGTPAGKKDAGGDAIMGEMRAEDAAPTWTLQEQMDHLTGYIQALAKGKGKGKGKGPPGKGGSKGGGKGDGKSGVKGDVFDGNCNHCGKYGHRKNACRQLDREMAEKGKGIREVGAEDEAEEQDNQQSGDWTLGTMWAITKDPPMQQKPKLQQRVTGSASGARPPVGSGSSNRFACLACADDEAVEPGPWSRTRSASGSRDTEVLGASHAPTMKQLSQAPGVGPGPLQGPGMSKSHFDSSHFGSSHGQSQVTFGACLAAARPTAALSQRARRQRDRADGGPSKEEQHLACLAATRAAIAAKRAEGQTMSSTWPVVSGQACTTALGSLQRDLPGSLVGAVAREGGVLEAVVDSGAEESGAPPGFFAAEMVPSPMSKAGGKYRAANGARIRNLGQQKVAFTTAEGHKCLMPFQVAEVERPLISVAQLTSAGNRVVLNDTGGQIVNAKTGKTIELVRRGGVYLLLMSIGVGVASDFPRQGK